MFPTLKEIVTKQQSGLVGQHLTMFYSDHSGRCWFDHYFTGPIDGISIVGSVVIISTRSKDDQPVKLAFDGGLEPVNDIHQEGDMWFSSDDHEHFSWGIFKEPL